MSRVKLELTVSVKSGREECGQLVTQGIQDMAKFVANKSTIETEKSFFHRSITGEYAAERNERGCTSVYNGHHLEWYLVSRTERMAFKKWRLSVDAYPEKKPRMTGQWPAYEISYP